MVIGNTYWWAIWHIKDDTEWTLFNNGSRWNKTEEMTKEDMAGRKNTSFSLSQEDIEV